MNEKKVRTEIVVEPICRSEISFSRQEDQERYYEDSLFRQKGLIRTATGYRMNCDVTGDKGG